MLKPDRNVVLPASLIAMGLLVSFIFRSEAASDPRSTSSIRNFGNPPRYRSTNSPPAAPLTVTNVVPYLLQVVEEPQVSILVRAFLIHGLGHSTFGAEEVNRQLDRSIQAPEALLRATAALSQMERGRWKESEAGPVLLTAAPQTGILAPLLYEELQRQNYGEWAGRFAVEALRYQPGRPVPRGSFLREDWSDQLQRFPLPAEAKQAIFATLTQAKPDTTQVLQIAELLLPDPMTEKFLRDGLKRGGWVQKWCDERAAARLAAKRSASWKAFRQSPSFATFRELFNAGGSGDRDDSVDRVQICTLIQSVDPEAHSELVRTMECEYPGLAAQAALALGALDPQGRKVLVQILRQEGRWAQVEIRDSLSAEAAAALGEETPEVKEYLQGRRHPRMPAASQRSLLRIRPRSPIVPASEADWEEEGVTLDPGIYPTLDPASSEARHLRFWFLTRAAQRRPYELRDCLPLLWQMSGEFDR